MSPAVTYAIVGHDGDCMHEELLSDQRWILCPACHGKEFRFAVEPLPYYRMLAICVACFLPSDPEVLGQIAKGRYQDPK